MVFILVLISFNRFQFWFCSMSPLLVVILKLSSILNHELLHLWQFGWDVEAKQTNLRLRLPIFNQLSACGFQLSASSKMWEVQKAQKLKMGEGDWKPKIIQLPLLASRFCFQDGRTPRFWLPASGFFKALQFGRWDFNFCDFWFYVQHVWRLMSTDFSFRRSLDCKLQFIASITVIQS